MSGPRTESGKQAVKMRGLFGGETAERATKWVCAIEAEAAALDAVTLGYALYDAQNQPWSKGSTQEQYYRNDMVELARMALARLEEPT